MVEHLFGSGVDRSSTAKEACSVLKSAMKSVGLVYNVPFDWLLEAVEQSVEDMFKGMRAFIYKPPHRLRQIVALSNLNHDFPRLQNRR